MSVDAHYFSPTTPGADSFDVDVSAAIRRGRIGPLSKEAQLGAVGSGVCVLDDVDGDLGHEGDGILGLKQWYMNETECPAGNQRFFTGYTFDRDYYRANSLVQGPSRTIDITLMDLNAFLSFRVFAPVEDDPTSSFVRSEEDHITRIQAMLTEVDFISETLFDLGYIPSTGGVLMSAKDYTKARPVDVVNDCAQAAGWNAWVGYDETENKLFLWFDDWRTDGSTTTVYDSTLRLTNVESERDDVTTFLFELNGREKRSPGRVVAAAYGEGTGITSYRTRPATAHTFGWRDMVAPAFFVKEQDKLEDLLDRYLEENSSEETRISLTVQLPVDKITAIKEGQRIPVHGLHMKSVAVSFTWCRILHMSIRRDVETMEFYWADLEVSPIPDVVAPCPDLDLTPEGYYPDMHSATSDGTGNVAYWNAGTTPPTVPTPGWVGNWGFPVYNVADGGAIGGSYDTAWQSAGNHARCLVIGPGTLTVHTRPGFEYTNGTYIGYVRYRDNVTTFTIETRAGCVPGVDQDFDIPADVLGVEGDTICHFWVDVEFTGAGIDGTRQIGFDGFDWVPAP